MSRCYIAWWASIWAMTHPHTIKLPRSTLNQTGIVISHQRAIIIHYANRYNCQDKPGTRPKTLHRRRISQTLLTQCNLALKWRCVKRRCLAGRRWRRLPSRKRFRNILGLIVRRSGMVRAVKNAVSKRSRRCDNRIWLPCSSRSRRLFSSVCSFS